MKRNLDVSDLPNVAFGIRSLQWWGTMGFIVIEAAIFAVLIATYLYGMARADQWPIGAPPPELLFGVLNTAILLVSFVPNQLYKHAAEKRELRHVRRWLVVALVLETAFLVVRGFEFAGLQVRWDDNFYGSILWTMLVFHTLQILSDFVESLVLLFVSLRERPDPHRYADMSDNALYWNFAILIWIPLSVLIYVVPRLG